MSSSCGDLLRAFDFRAEPIIADHTAPALTRGLSGLIHICIHAALMYKKVSSGDCLAETGRKDVHVSQFCKLLIR